MPVLCVSFCAGKVFSFVIDGLGEVSPAFLFPVNDVPLNLNELLEAGGTTF